MQRPSDPANLDLGILGDKKKRDNERYEEVHFGVNCDSENLSPSKYTILGNDISI